MLIEKREKELSVKQSQEENKMLSSVNEPKSNLTVWMFAVLSFGMGIIATGVWFFSRKR